MTHFPRFNISTALAVALIPQMANAQVTADEVWQNQKDYLATFGGKLVVSTARQGATLTISDAVLAYQLPFGVGSLKLFSSGFSLTENGDGTVAIAYADPVSYGISVNITDQGSFAGYVDITMQGYQAVASGVPRDVSYTWSADRLEFQIRDVDVQSNAPNSNQLADFTISGGGSIADLSGEMQIRVGELVKTSSTISMGRQEILVSGKAGNGRFNYAAGVEMNMVRSQTSLPRNGMDIMNLAAALRDGLALEVSTTTTGYNTSQIVESNGEVVSDDSTRVGEQSVTYALDQSGLRIFADALDTQIDMQPGTDLPFALKARFDRIKADFSLPLSASSILQDVVYSFSLEGVEMADELWDLFDPAKVLPRDPVSVTTNLSGKVLNKLDWLDFLTVRATLDAGEVPVELRELTLNELLIEMAGARLTGSGAATFDNSDLASFGGFPKPTGAVDLVLSGGNGLVDNLVAMGLLSDDDAMGARLGVAVIASPDPDGADDVLKSRLEMTKEGHILANGQRLQ